jgi:outer membrane protein assembly factor BamB
MLRRRVVVAGRLLILSLVAVAITTGCVASRIGTSWAAMDTMIFDGEKKIVVSFDTMMEVIDPVRGERMRLINPTTGNPRTLDDGTVATWVVNGGDYAGAQFFSNPLETGDNQLLAFTFSERFLVLDKLNPNPSTAQTFPLAGRVLSDAAVSDEWAFLPLHDGGSAAPNREGALIALDTTDYDNAWLFETRGGVWSPPVVQDGVVYFGSMDRMLRAIAIDQSGASAVEPLWEVDLGGGLRSTPLIHNRRLYIGSMDHFLYEVSLDGQVTDRFEAERWVWHTPVLDGGILYFADLGGNVYALDIANGFDIVWAEKVADRGIRSVPVVTEDRVIVATRDGKLIWLDKATGAVDLTREIDGGPEVLADLLVVEPDETLDIPEALLIAATVDPGKLLVAFTISGQPMWVYSR